MSSSENSHVKNIIKQFSTAENVNSASENVKHITRAKSLISKRLERFDHSFKVNNYEETSIKKNNVRKTASFRGSNINDNIDKKFIVELTQSLFRQKKRNEVEKESSNSSDGSVSNEDRTITNTDSNLTDDRNSTNYNSSNEHSNLISDDSNLSSELTINLTNEFRNLTSEICELTNKVVEQSKTDPQPKQEAASIIKRQKKQSKNKSSVSDEDVESDVESNLTESIPGSRTTSLGMEADDENEDTFSKVDDQFYGKVNNNKIENVAEVINLPRKKIDMEFYNYNMEIPESGKSN